MFLACVWTPQAAKCTFMMMGSLFSVPFHRPRGGVKRSSTDGLKPLESYWFCQAVLHTAVWTQAILGVRLIIIFGKLYMEIYMEQKKGFCGSLNQDCVVQTYTRNE